MNFHSAAIGVMEWKLRRAAQARGGAPRMKMSCGATFDERCSSLPWARRGRQQPLAAVGVV